MERDKKLKTREKELFNNMKNVRMQTDENLWRKFVLIMARLIFGELFSVARAFKTWRHRKGPVITLASLTPNYFRFVRIFASQRKLRQCLWPFPVINENGKEINGHFALATSRTVDSSPRATGGWRCRLKFMELSSFIYLSRPSHPLPRASTRIDVY